MLVGRLHYAFDAVTNEATLSINVQGVAVFPCASMGGRLVSASHDLARQLWRLLDGLPNHERRHLHAVLVEQIQKPGDAFVDPVLKESIGRQIRKSLLYWVRNDTAGSGDRLPAGLEHEREAYGQARAIWPERA